MLTFGDGLTECFPTLQRYDRGWHDHHTVGMVGMVEARVSTKPSQEGMGELGLKAIV